ncbi:Internalin-I [Symbiodinium microadriaticum]|uniref:Internalin-I n=1 Tax=Symbiodinium microadriaticum TaxID=2951 RepID=A0A1Q9EIK6_SYMMI|nr:Internalin-I [Symbiodinium microadriaticum]
MRTLARLPSWLTVPEELLSEPAPPQKRVKAVAGSFAVAALAGSLAVAALNVLAARQLASLFLPEFPVMTPLLFCLLAAGTFWGLCQMSSAEASAEAASDSFRWSGGWLKEFKATGKYFHSKAVVLEILQLINQSKRLMNLLYMGQAFVWICVYSLLICLNALVTPVLHFSPRVQNNTFFLVLFDAAMDTTFGAVLPVLMVTNVTITYLTTDLDMVPDDANAERVQAFLIGKGLVPTSLSELLSLAWPYFSLLLRLFDLQTSRTLWSQKAVMDHRWRCPRALGGLYMALGLAVGLLGMTARLRSPCWTKKWREGCCIFRFDLWGAECECAFYERRRSCSNEPLLRAMLDESRSLQVLKLHRCWMHPHFPALDKNSKLQFLYLPGNHIQELPPLSNLVHLLDLNVQENQLSHLPSLASNAALEYINVEQNLLDKLPPLDGNLRLRKLFAGYNDISEAPNLRENSQLSVLSLTHNKLQELLPLGPNPRLKGLFVSHNRLKTLPSLEGNPELMVLAAEWNSLESLPPLNKLPNLQMLKLFGNFIKKLPSLDASTELELLEVGMNKLVQLPSLQMADTLSVLGASQNALRELPPLSPNARLASLSLSYNKLRLLDLRLPQFQSLSSVDADYNNLEEVFGLENLESLKELSLAKNFLQQLPPLSRNLKNLDVGYNLLVELPGIDKHSELRHLNVNNNQLQWLPSLEHLTDLASLSVQCNHLTELWVFNASEHLEQILANNNLLSSLGPLPPSLQVLNLEWNRLQRLPDLVGRPKLESLNVAHNLLEDLPPLDNPELHQLDVFGNRLHELPCLHALPRLSVLDAGGNYLRELPQLQNLTSDLHVLCVGDNQLEVLPDLSTIRSLYVLGCEGNSFPQRPRIPRMGFATTCDCCETASSRPRKSCQRSTSSLPESACAPMRPQPVAAFGAVDENKVLELPAVNCRFLDFSSVLIGDGKEELLLELRRLLAASSVRLSRRSEAAIGA